MKTKDIKDIISALGKHAVIVDTKKLSDSEIFTEQYSLALLCGNFIVSHPNIINKHILDMVLQYSTDYTYNEQTDQLSDKDISNIKDGLFEIATKKGVFDNYVSQSNYLESDDLSKVCIPVIQGSLEITNAYRLDLNTFQYESILQYQNYSYGFNLGSDPINVIQSCVTQQLAFLDKLKLKRFPSPTYFAQQFFKNLFKKEIQDSSLLWNIYDYSSLIMAGEEVMDKYIKDE